MPLTPAQLATLKTYCQTSQDPAIQLAMQQGGVNTLGGILNSPSTSNVQAWQIAASGMTIDGGANYTTFDSLTQGKRDEWAIFLQYAPRDMSKAQNRATVTDVWGAANVTSAVSFSVLSACLSTATWAQAVIGGPTGSTGLVSAIRLNYTDLVTIPECALIVAP